MFPLQFLRVHAILTIMQMRKRLKRQGEEVIDMKVVKFGGSSLASGKQLEKVMNIIKADSDRRIVIVSAPGKRNADDSKVTDQLIAFAKAVIAGDPYESIQASILSRYQEIADELNIQSDVMEKIHTHFRKLLATSFRSPALLEDAFKASGEDNHAKLIKTATVGFGGEYYLSSEYARNGNFNCDVYDHPEKGLCLWGTKNRQYGQGGFYNAQSAEDIVSSINQFVSDVSVPIEGSTMGTNTIPVDALDSTRLQNYSYFPMFKPIAGGKEQLWAGNLKKFAVKTSTGTVVDQSDKPVFKDGKIQEKLSDYWFEANGSSDDDVYMAWGGLLSKLKVHHKPLITSGNLGFNRNVYLDIGVNNGNDLKHAVTDVLKGSETLENKKARQDVELFRMRL